MEENFKFEIISPDKIISSGEAKMVTLPSYEGDMSILKYHISIITFLRPGIIKIHKSEGSVDEFFVEDGTIEYFKENLVVLSASAKNLKNLSGDFVNDLSKKTQDELTSKDINDHDRYILSHKLDIIKSLRA